MLTSNYNQCNFIYYLQLVPPADVYMSAASYARRRFQTIHLSLYLLNHYYPRWTQIPYTLPSPSFLYIMPIMSLPFPPLSFFWCSPFQSKPLLWLGDGAGDLLYLTIKILNIACRHYGEPSPPPSPPPPLLSRHLLRWLQISTWTDEFNNSIVFSSPSFPLLRAASRQSLMVYS